VRPGQAVNYFGARLCEKHWRHACSIGRDAALEELRGHVEMDF